MIVKRRQMDASVPAMAMGDIAFLLLIFFVILARARDDSHLQWKPAVGVELVRPATMNASVVIDKYNVTHLNGREIPISTLSPTNLTSGALINSFMLCGFFFIILPGLLPLFLLSAAMVLKFSY